MHEAAAEAMGIRGHYQLIEIADLDPAGLRAVLEGVRRLGFAGVNVTFPYKEAVIPLLDALAPEAAMVGAVNTVVVREGRLIGHNTDFTGFATASAGLLAASRTGPVALLGAGGMGKAAAFALARAGAAELRILELDGAKASGLVNALAVGAPDFGGARLVATIEAALDGAVGLVNATPVGMAPDTRSPVPVGLLHDGLWVADAVYTPLWTPLLRAARAAGARVMTGRDLAIHQAVDAFARFAALSLDALAPVAPVMTSAFDAVMARRGVRDDALENQ